MKIKNDTIKAEVKRVAALYDMARHRWCAADSAAAIVRTVLIELGCKEELGDEFKTERKAAMDAIHEILRHGAAINFERCVLVDEGIAPKRDKVIDEPEAASVV